MPGPRRLHVHRAEPAVPDGQPVRVQRVRAAHVHRARRGPHAGVPPGGPSRGHRRGARRAGARRRRRSSAKRARVRRVPGVRKQHLYVHRRLPAVGQRRRHGASQQHDPHVGVLDSHQTGSICSIPISHEFFHAWNVERIRPQSLEPFNFEDANMSGELWLAEGFTSYYGPLILRRAGLIDVARLRSGHGRSDQRGASTARADRIRSPWR